jgi:hypothetical protein
LARHFVSGAHSSNGVSFQQDGTRRVTHLIFLENCHSELARNLKLQFRRIPEIPRKLGMTEIVEKNDSVALGNRHTRRLSFGGNALSSRLNPT